MRSPSPELLVAGAGPMAAEHVKALLADGFAPAQVAVAARRPERAGALAERYGVAAVPLATASAPLAIVAVAEDALAPVARTLLERGARRVLVEKPGALEAGELERLGGDVFVAYNRRFYPSVERARELIAADGGPLALAFDFTEVEAAVLADRARLDLAFHLAGDPVELHAERSGSLPWHPSGATFAGSGTTEQGALFAYLAAWAGAGRWSVEVTTRARRLVLRPLEALQQQLRGSFALEPVEVPREPEGVKPGLAAQLAAFLADDPGPVLCGAEDGAERIRLAGRMLGYA